MRRSAADGPGSLLKCVASTAEVFWAVVVVVVVVAPAAAVDAAAVAAAAAAVAEL